MKHAIIVSILLLALATACSTEISSPDRGNWRTGTEGIVMSYVPDNPPSEIVSSSNLNLMIKYANKGASDVKDLDFHVRGYDNKIIDLQSKTASGISLTTGISIGGKNQFDTQGSQEAYAEWAANTINMEGLGNIDNFKQSFSVTACYSYETIASPEICIDPKKYDFVADSRCSFDVQNLGTSQGAPIAVTEVRQKMTNKDIFLELHFENKGRGTPYLASNCLELGYTDVNKIKLESVAMSNNLVFDDCNPREIRLIENKGFAICRRILPQTSSFFQTPLKITVKYKYRETLPAKEVTIVNLN